MNEIKVIQSEPGKEIIVRVVHSRFEEDAWIGLFKAGSGDNEHGDRWKWMRDVDVSHITLPAQGAGEWSVRLFKDGGYDRISSLDFHVTNSHSSVDETDAESNNGSAIAFVVGLIMFVFGLPLFIIGNISSAPDRLAMLIPGAIMFGAGAFVAIAAAAIGMGFGKKATTSEQDMAQQRRGSGIEILEAVPGKPVRFRINNRPSSNDAWVGIYPVNAKDVEHGDRWGWLRDKHMDNASLPGQSEGRWSIRVFSDGGYTLHDRVDFDIVHSQVSEETEIRHGPHLHDPEKAAEFARALGLSVGGHHPFVGDWGVKGLYAYRSGKYKGQAYFGTGGSESDRLKDTYNSIKPGESHQKYRPWNRDDPKIPEEIRQKLIRLEERSSTRMNQTSQPSRNLSDVGVTHCKPGPRLTYADSEVYAAKMGGRLLTLDEAKALMGGRPLYPGEDQWCAVQGRDWVQVGDLYHHPGKSHNRECGGYPPWGDDANNSTYGNPSWNYVALYKIQQNSSAESTSFQTGWYRIETVDGSLIERVRVHQDKNHQARNEFIATGDLTGDVKWYVEGNTVKVPKFGGTGTIQADGNITWVDGNKAIHDVNSATRSETILNSDGRKYVFAHEHNGWHWHNERARAMGGHLASITNGIENEQITRISGGAPVWIGGIRKGSGNGPSADHWYWDDGRPWSYTNWHPGEPNNHGGGENRVHLGLQAPGTWNDVPDQWHGSAVYLVPNTESATSKSSSSSSPEIDILAQFKSKLKESNSHLSRIDELSSKFKKK